MDNVFFYSIMKSSLDAVSSTPVMMQEQAFPPSLFYPPFPLLTLSSLNNLPPP